MTFTEMQSKAATMTTDQLKDAQFINNMIDRWSNEDRMWDTAIYMELLNRRNK